MAQKSQDKSDKKGCLQKMGCLFSAGFTIFIFTVFVLAGLMSGAVAGWIGAGVNQKLLGALTGGLLAAAMTLLLWLLALGPVEKYSKKLKYPNDVLLYYLGVIFIGMLSGGAGGLVSGLVFNGDPQLGLMTGLIVGPILSLVVVGKFFGVK